jgi:hypothetical protein
MLHPGKSFDRRQFLCTAGAALVAAAANPYLNHRVRIATRHRSAESIGFPTSRIPLHGAKSI